MATFNAGSPFVREAERLKGVRAGTKPAIGRAVSSTKRALGTEAKRDIQGEYNLPARRIAQDLTVTSDAESITLTGAARPVGLEAFDGTWPGPKSEGASAKIFVGEGAHVYAGTFIAVANGNRQIFSRSIVPGGHRSGRLPIRALQGPNVASMLRKGDREERLGDFVQSNLAIEINRLLKITQPG